jgi:hypothetical protein
MSSFYQLNLALFASANAYLLYRQYARERKPAFQPVPQSPTGSDDTSSERDLEHEPDSDKGGLAASQEAVTKFQWDFFLVYALAVAADWLQVFPSPP